MRLTCMCHSNDLSHGVSEEQRHAIGPWSCYDNSNLIGHHPVATVGGRFAHHPHVTGMIALKSMWKRMCCVKDQWVSQNVFGRNAVWYVFKVMICCLLLDWLPHIFSVVKYLYEVELLRAEASLQAEPAQVFGHHNSGVFAPRVTEEVQWAQGVDVGDSSGPSGEAMTKAVCEGNRY